jgi:photosystem II stability/assembly factor-like uncharacterized protein
MNTILLLATSDGLAVCEASGDGWREIQHGLAGHQLTSVIAREGVILAGAGDGVYRSDDLGQSWEQASTGLSVRHIRWLAFHPDISNFEFAGTEPAAIFVSHDGADTWEEASEVAQMRDEYDWSLPYSPRAGCVRGFAFNGSHGYAAVEDGCVLASLDGGESWRLAEGSRGRPDHWPAEAYVHSDVHSIAVHPSSSDLVYAPTGGGFYRSMDGGATWSLSYKGCYCRAVWVDPGDSEHMILGPADGVDRNGRIEESHDGGQNWVPANAGLEVPWRSHMVERFAQVGDELFAVLSNGELLAAPIESLHWQAIMPELKGVAAVGFMKL